MTDGAPPRTPALARRSGEGHQVISSRRAPQGQPHRPPPGKGQAAFAVAAQALAGRAAGAADRRSPDARRSPSGSSGWGSVVQQACNKQRLARGRRGHPRATRRVRRHSVHRASGALPSWSSVVCPRLPLPADTALPLRRSGAKIVRSKVPAPRLSFRLITGVLGRSPRSHSGSAIASTPRQLRT